MREVDLAVALGYVPLSIFRGRGGDEWAMMRWIMEMDHGHWGLVGKYVLNLDLNDSKEAVACCAITHEVVRFDAWGIISAAHRSKKPPKNWRQSSARARQNILHTSHCAINHKYEEDRCHRWRPRRPSDLEIPHGGTHISPS